MSRSKNGEIDWEVNKIKRKMVCIILLALWVLALIIPLHIFAEQKNNMLNDDGFIIDVKVYGYLGNVPFQGSGTIKTTITEEEAENAMALKEIARWQNDPGELKPVVPDLFGPVTGFCCPSPYSNNILNMRELVGEEVLITQNIEYYINEEPAGEIDELILLQREIDDEWFANITLNGYIQRPDLPGPDPPGPDYYIMCLHQEDSGKIIGTYEQSFEYSDGTVLSWEVERTYEYDTGNTLPQDEIVISTLEEITINEASGDVSIITHDHYEPAVTLKSLTGGIGCKAVIKNYGTETVDVQCSFDIDASLMLLGSHVDDTFTLAPLEEAGFKTGLIIGFGTGTIQISVGDLTIQRECQIFGPFVFFADE